MSNTTPVPPPVVEINPETKEKLDNAVAKYYALMKAGKSPATDADMAAALKELNEVVDNGLRYDEESETWKDK